MNIIIWGIISGFLLVGLAFGIDSRKKSSIKVKSSVEGTICFPQSYDSMFSKKVGDTIHLCNGVFIIISKSK